jgi:hypothetical protein
MGARCIRKRVGDRGKTEEWLGTSWRGDGGEGRAMVESAVD